MFLSNVSGRGRAVFLGVALCLLPALGASRTAAQTAPADTAQLLQQIEALRAEQARIAALQQQLDASIRALESRLGVPAAAPVQQMATAPAPLPAATASVAAAPVAVPAVAPAAAPTAVPDRLKVAGDLRLRAQGDYSDRDGKNRNSSQLRARLGATYVINERLTIGGRVVTGDADDPNSSDVQLSNWDDDFDISLDLAYAQLDFGELKLYGGKIPQPFTRTDLVWDADVNPQGVGATYKHLLADGAALRANGLFFTIDEQVAGPDSYMGGAQVGYDSAARNGVKYDVSGAYYRYHLDSVAGADAGDWRSNRRRPDGLFLSDYELVDVIAGATWQGRSPRWPLRIVGDYVKNLGAVDGEDTGYSVELSVGRASEPGDWRFTYGYAQTDVDAVLAAFSNDNIGIATNYRLHALTVDYTPMAKTMISAIWYHYRPEAALYAGSNDAGDWLERFRLYFLINF